MKIITGKAKVKDDSTYIYKGHTLEVTGVYIEYKNGNGHGVYADGSREYKVSLIGTPFEEKYKGTVIHDKHLENLELYQEVVLPLDEQETLELIAFAKPYDLTPEDEILKLFLESKKGPHTPPTQDLDSLYDEEEWKRRNLTVKVEKIEGVGAVYTDKPISLMDEFKALFPLKGIVTQDIIDNANVLSVVKCIGAQSLRNALPEKFKNYTSWGKVDGTMTIGLDYLTVGTIENIDMMEVKKPIEVTFVVK